MGGRAGAAHPLLRTPALEAPPQLRALGAVLRVPVQALPELVPGPPARLPLLHRRRRHLFATDLNTSASCPSAPRPRPGGEPSAAPTAGPGTALPAVAGHGEGLSERREAPGPAAHSPTGPSGEGQAPGNGAEERRRAAPSAQAQPRLPRVRLTAGTVVPPARAGPWSPWCRSCWWPGGPDRASPNPPARSGSSIRPLRGAVFRRNPSVSPGRESRGLVGDVFKTAEMLVFYGGYPPARAVHKPPWKCLS